MIMNGQIVETNKTLILAPLHVLDKITDWFVWLYALFLILGEVVTDEIWIDFWRDSVISWNLLLFLLNTLCLIFNNFLSLRWNNN
jgi:hypothetical protein